MPGLPNPTWIETFQQLLHYYLPPLDSQSPLLNVGSLAAVMAGTFLAVRGARYDRFVVCAFALLLGSYLGYRVAIVADTPKPISAAVGAIALTALSYRTYKMWLAAGSVIVLFAVATLFQLGRGDIQRYLPSAAEAERVSQDGMIHLRTAAEQHSSLHPVTSEQLVKMKDRVLSELQNLGVRGWMLPAAAAILGILLALWALQIFAVIWLGFIGATMAVLGLTTIICAHWPNVRGELFSRPQITVYSILGVWMLGLILQAKEARFPRRKPAGEKPQSKAA
jgi:hypothetical protein